MVWGWVNSTQVVEIEMGLGPVLQITDLEVKRSKDFSLKISQLSLEPGKILGVAGPNGSGKTTLLEALAGILQPDGGVIKVCGLPLTNNLRQTKTQLGIIPDDDGWFVAELTAHEYFGLLVKVYEQAGCRINPLRIDNLAKRLQFTAFDQRLDSLSHGNKKKVQLIAGLMHGPRVIIVDELRNGLDPLAIIAAEQVIRSEAARGAAVVAASHDLWWSQRVTDETLLLSDGRVLVHNRTKVLVERYGSLENLFLKVARWPSGTTPSLV